MKTKNLFTTIKGSQMKWGVRQEDKTIQDKIIDSVYAQQNNLIVGRAGAGKINTL